MADDTNKSKLGPQNAGFGVDAIGRIEKATYRIPKSERDLRQTASTFGTQLNSFEEMVDQGGEDLITNSPKLSNIRRNAMNGLPRTQQRIRSSVESRLERGNTQFANQIAREYSESAINGSVREFGESREIQNRSFGMNGQSYEQLSGRRDQLSANIQALGSESAGIASKAFTSRGVNSDVRNTINGNAVQAQNMTQEMASIELALKGMKQGGKDPLSKYNALNASGRGAQDVLDAQSLGKELRSGGVDIMEGGKRKNVANSDIQGAIVSEAANLQKNLQALSEAAEKGASNLDDLRKKAEESAENFEKLKQAAGAGAGGMSKVQALSMAGGIVNTVGGAAQDVLINQRMGQTANTGGFANLANQQYDMYRKARGGDIASQLALGQFGAADNFGAEMKNATNMVQTATMTAGGLQAAAGAFQVAEGGADKVVGIGGHLLGTGGVSTEETIQGVQNVAQGAATIGVTASDMARGVTAQGNRLAGIQANMSARQAVNYVGASQAQGLRDFYTGLDTVGQSMGSKSSSFIQDSTSSANMQRMIDARIAPEQFTQTAQFGADQMGSTFDSNQVFASRNLERQGFGSTQTNMSRMSSLASAGANNPQAGLESVLSAAVTKGLDSSKSISMMVENTASMVSSSSGAAVGLDTTKAASSMLANSINPEMKNKEFAVQQAMTAAELTKTATTDKSVSFIGMANTAGLQKNLANKGINIGGTEALTLQGTDMATLKSLRNNPQEAAKYFRNQGVNINDSNANQFIETTITEKERQLLRPGGIAINADVEGLRRRMKDGTLSSADDLTLGNIANLQGRKGGAAELKREFSGLNSPNVADTAGTALTTGKSADNLKSQTDDLRTSGMKQLSEAAAFAADNLQKFGGAMKVFTDLQQKFEKGGKENEKDFGGAAGKFATEFTASIGKFDTATTKYEQASDAMMKAAGLLSNRNPIMPNFINNTLNEVKGSSRGK